MWTIKETAEGWQLVAADGTVIDTKPRYDQVLGVLGELLALAAADTSGDTTAGDGVLPEEWTDVDGIAFSEPTGDGRNFTDCVWTARDPGVSTMPLMLQTDTEIGHFGATLAGFFSVVDGLGAGTTPKASGKFYDSDAGRQLRDMLLDGRKFGVSVDNGAVDYEYICVQFDEEVGWCVEEEMNFLAYEIIGLTATPFPAFAAAAIQLGTAAAPAPAQAASGKLSFPAKPPKAWLEMAEPKFGDPLLVQQDDRGHFAVPLTIEDSGAVFGHLAYWGQCHVGYQEICVEPPRSPTGYARFNLRGLPVAEGGTVLTGPLVVGTEHYDADLFAQATDPHAHVDLAWADVHIVDGEFGPWMAGALRPQVTEEQLRVLRASSVSGEWRDEDDRGLDLVLGLTVNGPGFPIRAAAMAASGLNIPRMRRRARVKNDRIVSLSAANVVRRHCPSCTDAARGASGGPGGDERLARIERTLTVIEGRTRHLGAAEAADRALRLAASAKS